MATPFVGALTGTNYIQQFPVIPPYTVSATNPDTNIDWTRYTPISGAGSAFRGNKTPYTMSANVTIERQLGSNMLLSIGYTGSLRPPSAGRSQRKPRGSRAMPKSEPTTRRRTGKPPLRPFR
jgi:hypothetical protein